MTKCDLQSALSHARILTLDGQEIATGLLDAGSPEGTFQATGAQSLESIDVAEEVLAVVGKRRLHLVDWHRCRHVNAQHFHFRVGNISTNDRNA